MLNSAQYITLVTTLILNMHAHCPVAQKSLKNQTNIINRNLAKSKTS